MPLLSSYGGIFCENYVTIMLQHKFRAQLFCCSSCLHHSSCTVSSAQTVLATAAGNLTEWRGGGCRNELTDRPTSGGRGGGGGGAVMATN